MATIYYSDRCTNCTRFLEGVKQSSQLKAAAHLVNVDVSPVQNLQYVLDTGAMYVGTKAFEWLKQFGYDDAVLEPYSSSSCGTGFSEFNGDGGIQFIEPFSKFAPLD